LTISPGFSAEVMPHDLLERATRWASERSDIRGLALVGSHASSRARPDSDVDLVLLTTEPKRYLEDTSWVSVFGTSRLIALESWGKVTSVRVHYDPGPEVEFGITTPDWAASPVDAGTRRVVHDGIVVLLDPDGTLSWLASTTDAPR
jgi:predicted nucleotidyltransferase